MQHPNHPEPGKRLLASKTAAYYTEIKPILTDMAHLATLYRTCVFVPKGTPTPHRALTPDDFRIVQVWSNPEMEEVFTRLQALLAEIREDYFADRSA